MSSRSLNKVMLIGNLTRDPELRYTPQGTAVCTFGLATNRSWLPEGANERREETEFHRIVAWNKLGELCAQLLSKGRKVYVEGRLSTRSWTAPDGNQRTATEIVIEDMIILDSRKMVSEPMQNMSTGTAVPVVSVPPNVVPVVSEVQPEATAPVVNLTQAEEPVLEKGKKKRKTEKTEGVKEEAASLQNGELNTDDIPF